MRKVISLLMVCVMLACCTVMATAASVSPSDVNEIREAQKIARVKAEVLSGNITNEQDVIEVALAQHKERTIHMDDTTMCNLFSSSNENDSSLDIFEDTLTISQYLGSFVDESGNAIEEMAITGLAVVNEDGEQINPFSYTTVSGAQSGYSDAMRIGATLTMYVQKSFDEFGNVVYRANRLTTTVNGSVTADTVLRQYYEYTDLVPTYYHNESSDITPVLGNYYTFYTGDSWRYNENGGLRGWVVIRKGSNRLRFGIMFWNYTFEPNNSVID